MTDRSARHLNAPTHYDDFSDIPLVSTARSVCIAAHAGQLDKAGDPYWLHPDAVARAVWATSETDYFRTTLAAIAFLHDVPEDTKVKAADLRLIGFPTRVVQPVVLLTHDRGVSRVEYIEAIGTSVEATIVKLADLAHNLDPTRRWTPGVKQRQQYEADQRYLQRVLDETEGNE